MKNQLVTFNFSSRLSVVLIATFGAVPALAMPLTGTGGKTALWTSLAEFEAVRIVPVAEHFSFETEDDFDEGEGEGGEGDGDGGDGDEKETETPKPFIPPDKDDESAAEERAAETRSRTDINPEDLLSLDEPTQSIPGAGVPIGPVAQAMDEASDRIEAAQALCAGIPRPYRIDCLADQYAIIARDLPSTGELGEIKVALNTASRELKAIARANQDRTVARARAISNTIPGQPQSSRPLRAVRSEFQGRAERQALAVVSQLSTVLLRSAESATKNSAYFSQLAQAIDSNKVLLRSA